jgi:hypothetical protein
VSGLSISCQSNTLAPSQQNDPRRRAKDLSLSAAENDNRRPDSLEAATVELGRVPYGESSLQNRRTVYAHDDWLVHRSNDQLLGNLVSMLDLGIVRKVKDKKKSMSFVAIVSILYGKTFFLHTWLVVASTLSTCRTRQHSPP